MQLIFVVLGLLLTLTGGVAGFRYISKKDPRGKKWYLLYVGSIVLYILAGLALLYIIAAVLLLLGID